MGQYYMGRYFPAGVPDTPPPPLDHQAINVLCFADTKWRTGVLTKEVFCGVLGLCTSSTDGADVLCKKLSTIKFSSVIDEFHVKRPSRKSKSKAMSLIKQLATTGDV